MIKTMQPFCEYHIATRESPNGTDCSVHLSEGRCGPCIYKPGDIKKDERGIYISLHGRVYTQCQDFSPLEVIKDELIEKAGNPSALEKMLTF